MQKPKIITGAIRLIVLGGILIRAGLHYGEIVGRTYHGVSVSALLIVAIALYATPLFADLINVGQRIHKSVRGLLIFTECAGISFAYILTGKPESDFFLFFFVPAIGIALNDDWEQTRFTIATIVFFLGISVFGADHLRKFTPEPNLPSVEGYVFLRVFLPRLFAVISLSLLLKSLAARMGTIRSQSRDIEGFETVADLVPLPVFCKGVDGKFWFGNQAFRNSLGGIQIHDLKGRTDFAFYPENLAMQYQKDDQAVMAEGVTIRKRERHQVRGTQEERIVKVVKAPVREGSAIVGVVGIFSDETEQAQNEDRLNGILKNSRRQILNLSYAQSLSMLASFFAHDLKHPIGSIRIQLDKLSRNSDDPEKQLCNQCDALAEEMLSLIEKFLVRARGRMQFVNCNVGKCVVRAKASCWDKIRKKSIEVQIDATVLEGGDIECDEFLISQLFINIFENAVKHLPERSILEVSLTSAGNQISIEVCDDGPGFPVDMIRSGVKISLDDNSKASGFGLILVKNIVEVHGGSLEFSNRTPKGSRIRIILKRKIGERRKQRIE